MTDKPMLLIIGTNPITLKISASALVSTGMEVVTSCSDYRELAKGIDSIKPAVVLIWDIDNADDILKYILKWENAEYRSFFIVTTCYRNIFEILDEHLPGNAFPVFEPVDMNFLKKLIQNVKDGELNLGAAVVTGGS